jgi:hypothetical protein
MGEARRRRGPSKQANREHAIRPRHSQVGKVLVYAWIHPSTFERINTKRGGGLTPDTVMQELCFYCRTHDAQAEVFEGYPPVLRPDDNANGWQSLLVVRIDTDLLIRNRVQQKMHRLGCYTAISYAPLLPSERGNV